MSPALRCAGCGHTADEHTADPFRPACIRITAEGKCSCPGFEIRRPKTPTSPTTRDPWRVGHKLKRTIYQGEHLVGMMDSPGLAENVVVAMNRLIEASFEDDLPSAGLAEDRRNAEIARRGIRDAAEHLMEGAIAPDIKSLKRRVNALESFVFGLRGVLADQNVRLDDPNQRALRAALDAYDKSKEDPDA